MFALVFLMRLAVEPDLREHSPFVLFTLAVIASVIRGGFGPGVLATILGAIGGLYFSPPGHAFAIAPGYKETTIFQIALFFVAGGAMSWLGGELRESRWQAEDRARQREEMIESMGSGFAAFDAKGRCLYMNRYGERLTGSPHLLAEKVREVLESRRAEVFELPFKPTNRRLQFHASPARNGGVILLFDEIRETRTAAAAEPSLNHPRILEGLLHICANCKRIRDSRDQWRQMESYITEHSEALFSHGLCPACAEELYPGISKR